MAFAPAISKLYDETPQVFSVFDSGDTWTWPRDAISIIANANQFSRRGGSDKKATFSFEVSQICCKATLEKVVCTKASSIPNLLQALDRSVQRGSFWIDCT